MTHFDFKSLSGHIRFRDIQHYDTGFHTHHDLQITASLEHSTCEISWAQEDGTYEQKIIAAGQVCTIRSMLEHHFHWINKAHFISLYIKPTTICSVINGLYEPEEIDLQEIFGMKDDFIQHIMIGIRQTILQHGKKADAFYRASLSLLTHYVHQNFAIKHQHHLHDLEKIPCAKIRDAVNFIFQHIDRNLLVEEISQVTQMSPFHFLRTFKKMIGMSATRFHMVQRLEKAKDLLIHSEKSITRIATDLGFSSQSYFSTNFQSTLIKHPRSFAAANSDNSPYPPAISQHNPQYFKKKSYIF